MAAPFATTIRKVVPRDEIYEVNILGVPVETTVTDDANRALGWIQQSTCLHASHQYGGPALVWALDVRPEVLGIQALVLCWADRCLIFRISRSHVPQALRDFFNNPNNNFVAVYTHAKFNELQRRYGVGGHSARKELLSLAAEFPWHWQDASLDHLVVRTYGAPVSKPVGSNRWDLARLSMPNIQAACVDAYLTWEMATIHYAK